MSIEKTDLEVMDAQGVVDSPDHLVLSKQGRRLAQFMAAILMRHFDGWRWGITVDEKGGVVHIFALELSGDMGYTLLLDDVYNGGNFDHKLVLMAGGEILERFGLPRSRKKVGWQAHCRWVNGLPVPDVSDKKSGLLKHLVARNGSTAGA